MQEGIPNNVIPEEEFARRRAAQEAAKAAKPPTKGYEVRDDLTEADLTEAELLVLRAARDQTKAE